MHTNESRYAHVGLGGNSLQCPQMFVVLMRKDIIMSETEMVLTWPVWLNLTYCLSLSYPMQFLFCELLCFRTGISSPFGNFHKHHSASKKWWIMMVLLHCFIYRSTYMYVIFCRLVLVLSLYILGGLMFTVGYRKAEGKQIIPNVEFWSSMPGYVKVL